MGVAAMPTLFILLLMLNPATSSLFTSSPTTLKEGTASSVVIKGVELTSVAWVESDFVGCATSTTNVTFSDVTDTEMSVTLTIPSGCEGALLTAYESDGTDIRSPIFISSYVTPTVTSSVSSIGFRGYHKFNLTFSQEIPDSTLVRVRGTIALETVMFEVHNVVAGNKLEVLSMPFGAGIQGEGLTLTISLDGGSSWIAGPSGLTIDDEEPLRIGFIYAEAIDGSAWETLHNEARYRLEQVFRSRIETHYLENHFYDANGNKIDRIGMEYLINEKNCTLIVATGAPFTGTVKALHGIYPNVRFVIPSGWATSLPASFDRFACVKIQRAEMAYLAGMLAGGTTQSNILCHIRPFTSNVVQNVANAFVLGARRTNPSVQVISSFTNKNDPWFVPNWSDLNAVKGMRAAGCDILFPMALDDAATWFVRDGGYAIGWKNDLRPKLGDKILMSFTENYIPVYEDTVRDVLLDQFKGGQVSLFETPTGANEVSPFSPHVPAAIRAQTQVVLNEFRSETVVGRPFCGPFYRGDLSVVQAGAPSSVCLNQSSLNDMDYFVDGFTDLGAYVAPDELQFKVKALSAATYGAFSTLGAIVGVATIAMIGFVFAHSEAKVMKAASVPFLFPTLVGTLILACLPMLLGAADQSTDFDVDDGLCNSRPWIFSIAFTLLFGPLILKAVRIHVIFNSNSLVVKGLNNAHLAKGLLGMLFADVLLCVLWVASDPMVMSFKREDPTITRGTDYIYRTCESDNMSVWLGLLGTFKFGMIIFGTLISFKTRNAPSQFSEAKQVGLTIHTISMLSILGLPIVLTLKQELEMLFVTTSVILLLTSLASLGFVFGPKVVLVLNPEMGEGNGTVMNGTTLAGSVKSKYTVNSDHSSTRKGSLKVHPEP